MAINVLRDLGLVLGYLAGFLVCVAGIIRLFQRKRNGDETE